jgi:Leucine-rich repeat (LRR) protein
MRQVYRYTKEYTATMTKKNILILMVLVFLASGVFYKQLFKAKTTIITTTTEDNTNVGTSENKKEDTIKQDDIVISKGDTLNLSNQGLSKLPEYVTKLSNLEELNISNNKITGALPSQMQNLRNLKILNASNNQMTGVPAEIGQLSNLEVLDLSNNQLTGLPNELANLKKLKIFNLSGNNYSQQDLDVIKKGLPSNVQIIL